MSTIVFNLMYTCSFIIAKWNNKSSFVYQLFNYSKLVSLFTNFYQILNAPREYENYSVFQLFWISLWKCSMIN